MVHTGGGVVEVVTVVHPDARVVRRKAIVVLVAGVDVQRVGPPRTTGRRLSVAAENEGMVAVEVHRVHHVRVVRDRDADEIALLDHEHRHVRVDASVDGPVPTGPPVEEAEFLGDRELELAVEMARRRRTASAPGDRRRGGRSRPLRGVRRRRQASPPGLSSRAASDPSRPTRSPCWRHDEAEVVPAPSRERQAHVVESACSLRSVPSIARDLERGAVTSKRRRGVRVDRAEPNGGGRRQLIERGGVA